MEVQFAPNSVEESSLQFKIQRKLKVFETKNTLSDRGYNLLASVSKYGLLFICSPDGYLLVYYLREIIDKENKTSYLKHQLPEFCSHVAVNCDQEFLAASGQQNLYIFKILDFQTENISPVITLKYEINHTFVSALQWNPCIYDSLAISFFDGTLLVTQLQSKQTNKIQSKSRCLCWSPKGKQLVTGNSDGTLCQYKPDLSPMKTIPAPDLFEGAPLEVLAIHWISTFQFAAVYKNAVQNSRPAVAVINTPKTGKLMCFNYEDICYSMASNRPWYYYLSGISNWNMILASSSNSMEVATLSSSDGSNWLQWCQTDEARPELPLTDKRQENYPVGISVDTCAIHQLSWGENETLPYVPLLHIVSHLGTLTTFNIVNLNKQAPQICTPPLQFTLPSNIMTSEISTIVQSAEEKAATKDSAPANMLQPVQKALPQETHTVPSAQFVQNNDIQQVSPIETTLAGMKSDSNVVSAFTNIEKTQQASKSTMHQFQSGNTTFVKENADRELESKAKTNIDLKEMLIKEANDFQMEVYNYLKACQKTEIKLQEELNALDPNFDINIDSKQLQRNCSLEDLHSAVVGLKLELVRACAVVAEARTHSETKEMQQWTQGDPLTTKRLASIKKLAYYIQTQLEQAHRALEYRWTEVAASKEHKNPGEYMIRPILDDVYQPLVKHQEILGRQQAIIKSLRKSLEESHLLPFKTTSLLRSTPFKNKDPLSKLTKNILNLSIEPESDKPREFLNAQKLDALRDMLANHNIVKIKPINVEYRQQLAAIKQKYEKSKKERAAMLNTQVKKESNTMSEINNETYDPVSTSTQKQPSGLESIKKTLFTDDKPSKVSQSTSESKPYEFTPLSFGITHSDTRSILKDKLQNKIQTNQQSTNENINIFMGQSICSPSVAGSKPISATDEKKFQPQSFTIKAHSSNIVTTKPQKNLEAQDIKADNAFCNIFGTKISSTTSNVPDVLKIQSKPFSFGNSVMNVTSNKENIAVVKMGKENSKKEAITNDKENMSSISNSFVTDKNEITTSTSFNQDDKIKSPISTQDATTIPGPEIDNSVESPTVVSSVSTKDKNISSLGMSALASNIPSLTNSSFTPSSTVNFSVSKTVSSPEVVITEINVEPKISSEKSLSISSCTTNDTIPTATSPTVVYDSNNQDVDSTTPNKETTLNTGKLPIVTMSDMQTLTLEPELGIETSAEDKSQTLEVSSASSFAQETESTFPQASQVSIAEPNSTSDTSVFGSLNNNSSQVSIFAAQQKTTQSSLFSPTTQNSIFGSSPPTNKSIFGTPSQNSIFGTTTQASIFGSSPQVTKSSLFGPPTTTQNSIFSSSSPPVQGSIFSNVQTTQSSIFGQSPQTTSSSIFGSSPTATKPSLFGSPTPTTQSSIFGTPSAATAQTGSIFSNPESSFAAASISTTNASPNSGGSIFGSSGGSIFDNKSSTNIFGGKATFSQSNPTAASIFGSNQSPTPSTNLWAANNSAGTTGGLFSSGFGQNTTTQSSSIFGGGSFSAGSANSAFASPQQGSIFGQAKQSIFGSPQQQTAFGGSPVFGSKPVFGQSASPGGFEGFGGLNKSPSNAFGAPANFGGSSPGKIFGSASPGFAGATQSNATFESLATQNTLTFGNLAQQNTPQPQPAFNASPSFTGWRG